MTPKQIHSMVLLVGACLCATASAQGTTPAPSSGQGSWLDDWESALDNDFYKIHLNTRARMELADVDGNRNSYAFTVRNRFGIGSKPFYGFSGFVEGEGTFSFDNTKYWDGTGGNGRNRSIVADPEAIELNRAFGRFHKEEWWNVDAIAGRQRILIDDQRFVGNVGWRQNEQTFDATWNSTSLGLEGLRVAYGYLWSIKRIYSGKGQASTEDWTSRSHVVHLSYERFSWLKGSAFTYLFDFRGDAPGNSSNSYGFRLHGSHAFDDVWKVGYSGSYAYQTDAKKNTSDYKAHYGWIEGTFGHTDWATLGTGFEVLGSDDSDGNFVTPLATGHKFNGFADAFLDNGSVQGLRDYFLWIAPKLPFGFQGKVIYHRFWRDDGGSHIGDEWDFVISRKFWTYFTVLTKGAFFDGQSGSGRADRWRYMLQIEFAY